MAKITVPIQIDVSDVIIEALENIEIGDSPKSDDYTDGFYDCRNVIIKVLKRFRDGETLVVY